ncbi:MAG: BrnT family toxin [Rhodospirillales bacterium]|nr:BrnT family toxin [Rhodospirillales bacterium]
MTGDFPDGFEWDPAKCARNLRQHGIDFQDAIAIWQGPVLQRRSDRGADARFLAFGRVHGILIAVVWTSRGDGRRIISARRARRDERRYAEAWLAHAGSGPH